MPEIAFPPVSLDTLCRAPHVWGDAIHYPGLRGPSVVWKCVNCTAKLTATGGPDKPVPTSCWGPTEHAFLSQAVGTPCLCGAHTWGGFDA